MRAKKRDGQRKTCNDGLFVASLCKLNDLIERRVIHKHHHLMMQGTGTNIEIMHRICCYFINI